MRQGISIALLIAGITALVFGYDAYHSASSDVSRFFTGTATDKAVWLIIGGILGAVAGALGLILGPKAIK